MDIFMPGMSGQEATQQIRALPGTARNVPIIALTANVSADDETLFRAAGMDGILGKPVSLPELLDALGRYVWHKVPLAVPLASSTGGPAGEGDAAPLLAAERVSELRENLPPDMLSGLIEECLSDLEARLPALRRALTARVRPAIAAQAHAMVGMAAGYGMAALEDRLRQVMDGAREGEVDPAVIAGVESALARTAAALRDVLQKELA
jgi:CheY-like chemotaxis protein